MLPKIQYPIQDELVPSIGKKYRFRPFLVKEEKLLLMSKQGASGLDILKTMIQIVNNCSLSKDLVVENLSTFDIQYLYLRLRKISVGGMIEQHYKDVSDGKTYGVRINIDDIKLDPINKDAKTIVIDNHLTIMMKYPSVKTIIEIEESDMDEKQKNDALLAACVDKVFEEDKMFDCASESKDEVLRFIEELPHGSLQKIADFFNNIPKLNYSTSYTTKAGQKREIVFATVEDFFI